MVEAQAPKCLNSSSRGDKVPSLTVVLKLARGLGVSPADLVSAFSPSVLRTLRL